MICDTIIDAMGHTPLVRLNRMTVTVLPDTAERYFSTPLLDGPNGAA
jgi:cysteine synthase